MRRKNNSTKQLPDKQNIKALILVPGRDFGRCSLASRLTPALWPIADQSVLERLLHNLARQGLKKIAIACALLTSFVASSVWADAASDLKSRLDKVSSFHASFTQKVTDGSGNAVQEGQGDLWVKRPNLFNWHMTQPDESILAIPARRT